MPDTLTLKETRKIFAICVSEVDLQNALRWLWPNTKVLYSAFCEGEGWQIGDQPPSDDGLTWIRRETTNPFTSVYPLISAPIWHLLRELPPDELGLPQVTEEGFTGIAGGMIKSHTLEPNGPYLQLRPVWVQAPEPQEANHG